MKKYKTLFHTLFLIGAVLSGNLLQAAQMVYPDKQANSTIPRLYENSTTDFNFHRFLPLMEATLQATKSVEEQPLVLFLGPTGAGKSTTINYLLGHPMKRHQKIKKQGSFSRHKVIGEYIDVDVDVKGFNTSY